MTELTISIPMPSRYLSPNQKAHWATKARWARMQRHLTTLFVREALGRRRAPKWDEADVIIAVHPPDRRPRDRDNILASLKSAFDGAQDAGVVANDRGFYYWPIEIRDPSKANPRVEITFRKRTQPETE